MLENISSEEIKSQFKSNKKLRLVTIIIGGAIVLIAGYFLYRQFVVKPKNEKSQDAYWEGMNLVAKDSTDASIEVLTSVVKKYDGYVGGENAQYLLGAQLMKKGEFKKAAETLEGVNVDDTYISAMAIGLQGDCYSELGQYQEAVEKYIKASETNTNEMTTPNYLFKAALCAEELKDYEAALGYYTTIKDEYTTFANRKTIDKYIARVSSTKAK